MPPGVERTSAGGSLDRFWAADSCSDSSFPTVYDASRPAAPTPHTSGARLQRSDLFIDVTPCPPAPQPQRGDMGPIPHGHVAPTGLGASNVDLRCYRHFAPLGLACPLWIDSAHQQVWQSPQIKS